MQSDGGARDRITRVLAEVERERYSQLSRWGEQHHTPHQWLAILTEEVGEVAKEVADARVESFRADDYREELVQVAAVAVAAIESLDRESVRRECPEGCRSTEVDDEFLSAP